VPLDILYEDADCLAVVKPAGQFTLGTWAPPGETTLEAAIRRHLDAERPDSVYLGVVHRLDRPTSGVLLWGKTPKAARRLSRQFERRRVVKEYWALVAVDRHEETQDAAASSDALVNSEATWCDWLTRTARTGLARVVPPGTPGARQAVTRIRREPEAIGTTGATWLRLWPETGRTHQLRAQSAARGMPIVGDAEYGSKAPFGPPHAIALHARSLQVQHPTLQTPMTLVAPVPPDWRQYGFDPGAAG
jgi:23S rRNA pseudouridine1911/1915/1917 synthase